MTELFLYFCSTYIAGVWWSYFSFFCSQIFNRYRAGILLYFWQYCCDSGLFELGLNSIITQYVAHEVSYLSWKTPVELSGEEKYKSRLASLLHFCVKWYLGFAGILLITLIIVGYSFFNRYGNHNDIDWHLPWLLLAFGTALNLLLAPVSAF